MYGIQKKNILLQLCVFCLFGIPLSEENVIFAEANEKLKKGDCDMTIPFNPETKLPPYGVTDFERIICDNYYYVDKTNYIPLLERVASFFFIVRPRRFGKSLFLNMLESYYDIRRADTFEKTFGQLYIGQHPTANRSKYLVLKLNFSGISADPEKMQASFDRYCLASFNGFCQKYTDLLPANLIDRLNNCHSAPAGLDIICIALQARGLKMYLILDEYDNFANNLLASYGTERYRALTHGDGFLREFLKSVKIYTESAIERIYITGVSPVTMDDLTSGFNIADNYSTDERFNAMIGFTENEVRALLAYYEGQGLLVHTIDQLVEMMKPWYDNYCFATRALDEPPMYNSDMVLYFVNRYIGTRRPPEQMLDTNCRTDYNKLRRLIQMDKTFGVNASVIQEIITTGGTNGVINPSFPAENIVRPDNFRSLLFYYGMLTFSHELVMGYPRLVIPNMVVREQLYSYLAEAYRNTGQVDLNVDELNNFMSRMAYLGEWENYFCYIAEQLKAQSAIREFMEGEAHVKGFILAYMGMNPYYMALPEYEMNKGFSDFFLRPNLPQMPDMPYSYVVEVKYCARDSAESLVDKLQAEATEQVRKYATCEKIQYTKGTTELRKLVIVFRGWELLRVVEV